MSEKLFILSSKRIAGSGSCYISESSRLLSPQADFCRAMSAEDGNAPFIIDQWQRQEGSSG